MSKSGMNSKGRSERTPGGYFKLHRYVVRSEAWKATCPQGRCLYLTLLDRYRDFGKGQTNNGRIALGHRQAMAKTGLTDWGVRKGFADLVAKGFIRVTRRSAFNMKQHLSREFALTEYPVGNALATKDFMRWRPKEKENAVLAANTGCDGEQHGGPKTRVHKVRKTPLTVSRSNTTQQESGVGGRHTSNNHALPEAEAIDLEIPDFLRRVH